MILSRALNCCDLFPGTKNLSPISIPELVIPDLIDFFLYSIAIQTR